MQIQGQTLDSGDRGACRLFVGHTGGIDTHRAGDVTVLLHGGGKVVFHDDREKQSVRYAVRDIESCAERMRHRVDTAESDIRECHAGNILGKSHILSRGHILAVFGRGTKVLGDPFNRLNLEHIRKRPCALGDVALDRVGESVHTGSGGQSLRHRRHQLGINDRKGGNVVRVDADHLTSGLFVGDDIVDRNLRRSTCGGGQCDDRNALFLGIGNAFQRDDVGKLGVIRHDGDALRRIDGRTAADRNDKIRTRREECGNARLHVLYRGIGFEIRENLIRSIAEFLRHEVDGTEFQKVVVGNDQCLAITASFNLSRDLSSCAGAEIRGFIEDKSVSHNKYASLSAIGQNFGESFSLRFDYAIFSFLYLHNG